MSVPRGSLAALLAFAASFTLSCGSPADRGPPALPGTPSPTPAPPPPSALACVLDPAAGALLTFEADSATGQLRLIEAREESEPRLLSADPGGRFLYLAGGDSRGVVRSYVRSYAIDPARGLLNPRSHRTWDSLLRPPLSLAASARQVYVVGGRPFTGTHGGWVAFDVDAATGSLGEAPRPPRRFEPDIAVADPEGRFVYTEALDEPSSYSPTLFVSAVRGEGRLEDVGSTVVEAAPSAGVLGLGFLFLADSGGLTSFAVDEASGLPSPRARLSSTLGGAARLALGAGSLLAVGGRAHLLVYAVGSTGELSLRDEIALASASTPRSVAIHPTGRYLYASGAGEGVRIFAVGADGRLQDVGREPRGGGAIVLIALSTGGG